MCYSKDNGNWSLKEIQSATQFLCAKHASPTEIHHKLTAVNADSIIESAEFHKMVQSTLKLDWHAQQWPQGVGLAD